MLEALRRAVGRPPAKADSIRDRSGSGRVIRPTAACDREPPPGAAGTAAQSFRPNSADDRRSSSGDMPLDVAAVQPRRLSAQPLTSAQPISVGGREALDDD